MFAEGKEWDDDPKPTADDIIEVINYLGYHCFNISIIHDKSHHMWVWSCQIKKIEDKWMHSTM